MHLITGHEHDLRRDGGESGASRRRVDDLLGEYEHCELDGGQNPQDLDGDLKEEDAHSETNDQSVYRGTQPGPGRRAAFLPASFRDQA